MKKKPSKTSSSKSQRHFCDAGFCIFTFEFCFFICPYRAMIRRHTSDNIFFGNGCMTGRTTSLKLHDAYFINRAGAGIDVKYLLLRAALCSKNEG